jgi:hypothetical protein
MAPHFAFGQYDDASRTLRFRWVFVTSHEITEMATLTTLAISFSQELFNAISKP